MCQVVEDLLNVCENPRRRKRHMKKNVSLVSETGQLLLEQKKVLSLVFYKHYALRIHTICDYLFLIHRNILN